MQGIYCEMNPIYKYVGQQSWSTFLSIHCSEQKELAPSVSAILKLTIRSYHRTPTIEEFVASWAEAQFIWIELLNLYRSPYLHYK